MDGRSWRTSDTMNATSVTVGVVVQRIHTGLMAAGFAVVLNALSRALTSLTSFGCAANSWALHRTRGRLRERCRLKSEWSIPRLGIRHNAELTVTMPCQKML
jgi:hypothetical protein